MRQSLWEYVRAVGYWWFIVIAPVILGIVDVYQLASGNQFIGIPSWVWFPVAFVVLLIIPFIAFHKVRVLRDEALRAERALVLTPHTYAIGLSDMTGYPDEPDNADWLCLEVAVNPINKPIDTLDLIIDEKTIPANHCPGKIVTAFSVYFNVTEWRWKGENQVELIAHVGGKTHSSGRITIDFDVELGGSHRI